MFSSDISYSDTPAASRAWARSVKPTTCVTSPSCIVYSQAQFISTSPSKWGGLDEGLDHRDDAGVVYLDHVHRLDAPFFERFAGALPVGVHPVRSSVDAGFKRFLGRVELHIWSDVL
jgi:hypothetical protein